MENMTNNIVRSDRLWPWLAAAGVFFFGGFAVLIFILYAIEPESRGPTGDTWGGALGWAMSAASTCLFVATLVMQRHELNLQREELKKAMEVAKEQKNIAAAQVDLSRQDAFRRTLTQLLEVRNSLIADWPERYKEQKQREELLSRYARLSWLVEFYIKKVRSEDEQKQWVVAFGPWDEQPQGVGVEPRHMRPPWQFDGRD